MVLSGNKHKVTWIDGLCIFNEIDVKGREPLCLLGHQIHFALYNINSRPSLLICASGSIGPDSFLDDLLKNLAEHFANHIDDSFIILFFVIDDDN